MADTTILRTSRLAVRQQVRLAAGHHPPIPLGYFLLADAGFTLVPWVVMNFSELECNKDRMCRKFNGEISKARVIVERSFGQLKQRYNRIGGRTSYDRAEQVCKMVRAVTGLHNLCIESEAALFNAHRLEAETSAVEPNVEVARIQRHGSIPSCIAGSEGDARRIARAMGGSTL